MNISARTGNVFLEYSGTMIPIPSSASIDQTSPTVTDLETTDVFVSFRHEPTFAYEDIRCPSRGSATMKYSSSCVERRSVILRETLLDDQPSSVSDRCWLAMKCDFLNRQISDPQCHALCPGRTCRQLAFHSCPPMWNVPDRTVAFGHMFFLYVREDMNSTGVWPPAPRYVCYNAKLCDGLYPNRSLVYFHNATCRRPQDFPLQFNSFAIARGSWHLHFVTPLYRQLSQCDKIIYNDFITCDPFTMYQCVNSSKCIPKRFVCNLLPDCEFKDDEQCSQVNGSCSTLHRPSLFQCTTKSICISFDLVDNGQCDCGTDEGGLCDDEDIALHRARKQIAFPTTCDGFQELLPVFLDGQKQTDETECQQWLCNNTYTRCDGFWNCLNGADEVDCNRPSSALECPRHHHICVAPNTTRFTCLPLNKANDHKIDCLGGTDEPALCRSSNFIHTDRNFYCNSTEHGLCVSQSQLCYTKVCRDRADQQICLVNRSIPLYTGVCDEDYRPYRSAIEHFFCARSPDNSKPTIVNFALGGPRDLTSDRIKPPTKETLLNFSITRPALHQYQQLCHRGLAVHVWSSNRTNATTFTCLCPPSFYGHRCQNQNQRVSLTMRVDVSSGYRRTPFIIIPTLIDDSAEQIIHSYQQLTYLHIRHCQRKFNIHLLYSKRPKDPTKNYSIRIDLYEKTDNPTYHGSVWLPFKFSFLPVHRVAVQLQITPPNTGQGSCADQLCQHGQCARYLNDPVDSFFCRCHHGWSGKYCNISHACTCSFDSLCVGVSATNRSICVCPANKWGSRCLLRHTACQWDLTASCNNRGQCVPNDINSASDEPFVCICRKGFHGTRCEFVENKLVLSFHPKISVPELILVHFVRVIENGPPTIGSTFKTRLIDQQSMTVLWSYPYNIAFLDFFHQHYYFITTAQQVYNSSSTMVRTITPSDRCKHVTELLTGPIGQLHLLRRIKYYHLICRNHLSALSCFYDEAHLCLCHDYGNDRLANCLEFNHTLQRDCSGVSDCENGAQCLQDRSVCPQMSTCVCPKCYYGKQCQFSSSLFDLSLDAILGYYIQPHVSIFRQLPIVKVSMALAIIITAIGLLSGILSMFTFQNKESLKAGCGLYLLVSSITASMTMIGFLCKYAVLLIAQMSYVTHQPFLSAQCFSLDFLIRVGLSVDQWLSACVSVERAVTTTQAARFKQERSKQTAKYVIAGVFVLIISTTIHDPLHRRLLYEADDNVDEKRIWCIASYSVPMRRYNSVVFMLHFFIPFLTNIFTAVLIILLTARQRTRARTNQTYRQVLLEQLRQFTHLLIGPVVFVVLAIPRLIISFTLGCVTSSDASWLYLLGYLLSLAPSMFGFLVFVKPSELYMRVFRKSIEEFRLKVQRYSRSIL